MLIYQSDKHEKRLGKMSGFYWTITRKTSHILDCGSHFRQPLWHVDDSPEILSSTAAPMPMVQWRVSLVRKLPYCKGNGDAAPHATLAFSFLDLRKWLSVCSNQKVQQKKNEHGTVRYHHCIIFQHLSYWYMGVSKNSGTPKSSILIGSSILNHPFWGTPILGNTHISHHGIRMNSTSFIFLKIIFQHQNSSSQIGVEVNQIFGPESWFYLVVETSENE